MRKSPATVPLRRGRQRSAEAEAAILKAAAELFSKKPLSEVTSEAIAQRAGVSKATIYKWWPNKTLVALDAFSAQIAVETGIADTGSTKEDFKQQLREAIAFFTSPLGRMLRQFLAEGQSDPAFLEIFRARFLKPRRDSLLTIWRRGVSRGDVRPELDGELVLDLIFGPMVYRLLAGHGPLDEGQAAEIVDTVFRGVQKDSRPAAA
jgi:AcrR family transcriptional regulator